MVPAWAGSGAVHRGVAALARGHRAVDGLRRIGRDVAMVATEQLAFGDDVPASYVAFVDQMLAATPFEVVAEFFPGFGEPRQVRRTSACSSKVPTTVICGTDDKLTSIGHSRKLSSPDRRLDAARVPRRRPHGDPRAARRGQRRARPAARRHRRGGRPVTRRDPARRPRVRRPRCWPWCAPPSRRARRSTRPPPPSPRPRSRSPPSSPRTAGCSPASTARPVGALVLDPIGSTTYLRRFGVTRRPRATASPRP